jgi:rare lipoprotein A
MQKHIVVAIAAALSVAGLSAGRAHADREVIVQPGENMLSISLRYYGDENHVGEIVRYNHLATPDLIYAGLRLALPDLPADGSIDVSNLSGSSAGDAGTTYTASTGSASSASTPDSTPPMPPGAPEAPAPFALPVLSTPGSPDAAPPGTTTSPAVAVPGVAIDSGLATWYGPGFVGSLTYCGDVYDEWAYTAASNTLSCGTVVVVTNQANGASVRVRINDRGGFGRSIVLDLSRGAFSAIAPMSAGVAHVTVSLPAR